jgi:hypothetical protein
VPRAEQNRVFNERDTRRTESRTRIRTLLDACHRVIEGCDAQLDEIHYSQTLTLWHLKDPSLLGGETLREVCDVCDVCDVCVCVCVCVCVQ